MWRFPDDQPVRDGSRARGQERYRRPIYCAFNVLEWNGADLWTCPVGQQKEFLKSRLPVEPTQILYAGHVEERHVQEPEEFRGEQEQKVA